MPNHERERAEKMHSQKALLHSASGGKCGFVLRISSPAGGHKNMYHLGGFFSALSSPSGKDVVPAGRISRAMCRLSVCLGGKQ